MWRYPHCAYIHIVGILTPTKCVLTRVKKIERKKERRVERTKRWRKQITSSELPQFVKRGRATVEAQIRLARPTGGKSNFFTSSHFASLHLDSLRDNSLHFFLLFLFIFNDVPEVPVRFAPRTHVVVLRVDLRPSVQGSFNPHQICNLGIFPIFIF